MELVENRTIRIIDIVFAQRDGDGRLRLFELDGLDAELVVLFNPVVADITGMLSEDDQYLLASALENNSSAAIMLFENVWATRFADAMRSANGQLVFNERIPRAVIEELVAAHAAA